MTNSNKTQKPSATKTYDVHTTGFGYLNDIRIVTPKHGGNPYLSCNITLQEGVAENGDFSKINKIYFQANIVGAKAKALMHEYLIFDEKGKSEPNGPVTAVVRLGGINVETFTYKNGEKAGQMGVALKTRLLKINWLKIGDYVLPVDDADDASTDEDNAKTEVVAEAKPETENDPESVSEESAEDTQPVSVATATDEFQAQTDRPVRLDKDDPHFEAKKSKLKELGYRWNNSDKTWVKPMMVQATA